MPPRIRVADAPPEPVLVENGHIKVAAEPDPVVISQIAADAAVVVEDGWRSMDNAPRDGTLIRYRSELNGEARYAKWKTTRVRDPELRKWVQAGWWYSPFDGLKIEPDPIMWQMPEGFNAPGLVV